LLETHLQNLSDSIFTSAGLIDGDICYTDYLEVLLSHPIIEMFLSPQYQGIKVLKTLDTMKKDDSSQEYTYK